MPRFKARKKVPPVPDLSGGVKEMARVVAPFVAEKAKPLIENIGALEEHLKGSVEKMDEIQEQADAVEYSLVSERKRVDNAIGNGINNSKKIDELEGKVAGLKTEVENLKNDVKDAVRRLDRVYQILDESNIESVRKELEELKATVSGVQDRQWEIEKIAYDAETRSGGVRTVVEEQKKEMDRIKNSITPPPGPGALKKDDSVISIPPAAVTELPDVEDEATSEMVIQDEKDKAVPAPIFLKIEPKTANGGNKGKYSDATLEKAKEQAAKLKEMEPDVEDVVGAVKDIREKLKTGGVFVEHTLGHREKIYLESIEGQDGELTRQTAENLSKAYSFSTKIKTVEHPLVALAAKNKLGKERMEMLEKIRDAKKPLSEFKLMGGDINEAQAYTEALIKSQNEILEAMAKTIEAVVSKIEGEAK